MQSRHSLGSVARITLDLIVAGVGAIGEAPTVAILRRADNKWFQVSDGTWQVNIVDNAMTQTDVTNLPGRYHFDFDQTFDDELESTEYLAKKVNSGAPIALEYEDLVFGPMAAAAAQQLCSIQGSVRDASGEPVRNELVRATLRPVFVDSLARATKADSVTSTYTNDAGDFDLPLVRGGVFRLEIPGIGYDRKVTVPDQASVLFTDL